MRVKPLSLFLSLLALSIQGTAIALPIVAEPGYNIEQFVSGAGAVVGMAFNSAGDLYFAEYVEGRILKVTQPLQSGINLFSIVATGIPFPDDLTFNPSGRLFVVAGTSDIIEVLSDGSLSSYASGFSSPTCIASYGNDLFVCNSGSGSIAKVDSGGGISLYVSGFSTPNGPFGLSVDTSGALYFADHGTGQIYKSIQAGQADLIGSVSPFGAVFTVADLVGDVFVSDVLTGEIYKFDGSGNKTLFASGFTGKANPPVIGPTDMVFDGGGNLYIGDGPNIWKISRVSTIPNPSSLSLICIGGIILCWHISSRQKASRSLVKLF